MSILTGSRSERFAYAIFIARVHIVWIVRIATILVILSSHVEELFTDVRESTSVRYLDGTGISVSRSIRLDLVILGL